MRFLTGRTRRQGFTLIELLVTIAIISILAAILFPVFARAREGARRTSCLSNMKQIGLGVMMYVQDYDEKYPPSNNSLTQTPPDGYFWSNGAWFWQQMIYPYTKSSQVYECPSAVSHPVGTSSYNLDKPIPYKSNYGANSLILRDGRYFPGGTSTPTIAPASMASVNSPSETYLIADFGFYRIVPSRIKTPTSGYGYLPGGGAFGIAFYDTSPPSDWQEGRHFDGNSVAFADGHAKWVKSNVLYAEALKCTSCIESTVNPVGNSAWNPFRN